MGTIYITKEDRINRKSGIDILNMLIRYDSSFIPPLSTRDSTCQSELHTTINKGVLGYFNELQEQRFILAIDKETEKIIGFLSYKYGYTPEILKNETQAELWIYITTIIIAEEYRRHGIAYKLYNKLIDNYDSIPRVLCTRTWSTNIGHISLLKKEKFIGPVVIKDDRAPGIDTVYYYKRYDKCEKNILINTLYNTVIHEN